MHELEAEIARLRKRVHLLTLVVAALSVGTPAALWGISHRRVITAAAFVVRDRQHVRKGLIGLLQDGQIAMSLGPDGEVTATVTPDGRASLTIRPPGDTRYVLLGKDLGTDVGLGLFQNNSLRCGLIALPDGASHLSFSTSTGRRLVALGQAEDGASMLGFYDALGRTRFATGISTNGRPYANVYGEDGRLLHNKSPD